MWSQFQALLNDFVQVPTYHLLLESFLLFWILWLLARRFLQKRARNRADLVKLTKEEEEELLAEWKPEPLVPLNLEPEEPLPVIEGKAGKEITIDGVKCWNFATHNYLGFAGRQDIEEEAIKSVKKFGVGSCGPRAFYGTAGFELTQLLKL